MNEDKTLHDTTTSKPGASPPNEHKQHLHLPLRKRHLLASSTGSHHNEHLGDSNHAIPTQPNGQAQDVQHSTYNISTDLHQGNNNTTKPIDTRHTQHIEPPEPPENDNTEHPTEHTPSDYTLKVLLTQYNFSHLLKYGINTLTTFSYTPANKSLIFTIDGQWRQNHARPQDKTRTQRHA